MRDKALTIPAVSIPSALASSSASTTATPASNATGIFQPASHVIGVGNVGLDIARILAKTGDELLVTEIPDNVYASLSTNQAGSPPVRQAGPAQAKFTPEGTQGVRPI